MAQRTRGWLRPGRIAWSRVTRATRACWSVCSAQTPAKRDVPHARLAPPVCALSCTTPASACCGQRRCATAGSGQQPNLSRVITESGSVHGGHGSLVTRVDMSTGCGSCSAFISSVMCLQHTVKRSLARLLSQSLCWSHPTKGDKRRPTRRGRPPRRGRQGAAARWGGEAAAPCKPRCLGSSTASWACPRSSPLPRSCSRCAGWVSGPSVDREPCRPGP